MKVMHLSEKEALALARLVERQDLTTSTSAELDFYRYFLFEIDKCFGTGHIKNLGIL